MRIAGIQLPDEKRLDIALRTVYGIGPARAREILAETGIDPAKLAKEASTEEEAKLRQVVESFTIEGDLKREIQSNVKRLQDIKTYRGSRHAKRLPARGQRTKTNSRTRRGNVRQTMGTGRRKVEKK